MQIRHLSLANFRVYAELDIDLGSGLNFFQGRNGQGKTALLEAIYSLATSRSFRTAQEQELMRWGESMAWVRGELQTAEGRSRQLAVTWQLRRGKAHKELSRRGQKVERLADFLGELPLALFTPDDLALVQGAPAERRRFLDLILCKLFPAFVECLARYQKVLAAKNALLKRQVPPIGDELEPWNLMLAPLAAETVQRRHELLRRLGEFVQHTHDELTGQSQPLGLSYQPRFEGDQEQFFQEMQRRQRDEMARGTSLVGPHRDDFELRLEGMDVRRFGSQGQCRSLALALRLAQAAYLQALLSEPAVVLLDDCFSELDPHRQERLLRLLSGYSQVAVTSATPVAVAVAGHFYQVEGGSVKRQ